MDASGERAGELSNQKSSACLQSKGFFFVLNIFLVHKDAGMLLN